MKKFIARMVILIWFFAGLTAYGAEPTVKIATGEWPPFMSKNLTNYGFITHIVTESFAMEGVKAEYLFYPWARAMQNVKRGEVNASSAWYCSKEREQSFLFSDPLFLEQQVFFHLADNPFDWKTIDDLKGKRIGATIGYFYGEDFKKGEDSKLYEVERVSSDEINFKKLLAGRIDAALASLFVGNDILKKNFSPKDISKITSHSQPIHNGPLHLIFPKTTNGKKWLTVFNKGLGKMKAGGRIDTISDNALKGKYN